MQVRLITWNCNGLNSSLKLIKFLKKTKQSGNSNYFTISCLQEIKLQILPTHILTTLEYYGLDFNFHPSTGRSGGLLITWNKNTPKSQASLIHANDASQALHFHALNLTVLNNYIKTSEYPKYCELAQLTFDHLTETQKQQRLFLLGDLNSYNNASVDRLGQSLATNAGYDNDHHITIYKRFSPILEQLYLEDVAIEPQKTECTHQCKRTGTKTRIDYIFSNRVNELDSLSQIDSKLSDHSILIFELEPENQIDIGPGYWRLNNNILPCNKDLINSLLSEIDFDDDYDVQKQGIREMLRNICIQKQHLESKYKQNLKTALENCEIPELKKMYQNQMEDWDEKEGKEMLACMKATVREVYEGDPREVKRWFTKFQPSTIIKKLTSLDGQQAFTETSDIADELKKYYKKMFKNEKVDNIKRFEVLRTFRNKISMSENQQLSRPITVREVENAILLLQPSTSPGPDGLTTEFYQQHKEMLAPWLQNIFNKALHGQKLPKSFKKALIKLLPKTKNIPSAEDFRPISLINADQKILSHILAQRLKCIMGSIISNSQYAYLPNRDIHQAIISAKLNLDNQHSLVSLDFSKAFDRVDRAYLFQLLRKMNFPEPLITIIVELYRKTKSSLVVNGYVSKELNIERGVKQGCPLSALLFIICVEPLLERLKTSSKLAEVSKTVILFADDVTVLIEEKDVDSLFYVVEHFCAGTQFKLNLGKCKTIGKSDTESHVKMLGVYIGRENSAQETNEKIMIEAIHESKRLFNMQMSLRAKAKILQTFVIPKVLHIARHQKTTNKLCTEYRKLCSDALWGRGRKAYIALKFLERDPSEGGIGLPNLKMKIVAAKLIDLKNILFSTSTDAKKIRRYWKSNKFLKQLRSELKGVSVNISEPKNDSIIIKHKDTEKILRKATKLNELYNWLLTRHHSDEEWSKRIERSCTKFGIPPNNYAKISKWLWKQKNINTFQKNLFYKMVFNCFPDKELLWDKGQKRHPLCFLCESSFETWDHLFGHCSTIKTTLSEIGIHNLWDIAKLPLKEIKVKAVSIIVIGSWRENADETILRLRQLSE